MAAQRIGFSEGKACDAVVRVLENRNHAQRQDVSSPEQERHAAPVELVFKLNDAKFALEHTGIEPFGGHVEITARAIRDLVPVQDMIAQETKLSEHVLLEVPEAGLRSIRKADVAEFQKILVDWAFRTLPSTVIAKMGRYPTPHEPYSVPGISFPVWLHRMETLGHDPFVRVSVQIDAFDREKTRLARIEKACVDKFPKLWEWKRNGVRTVLVLEDNDIQFTNQSVVADALIKAIKGVENTPDEIWLVISCTEPWFVFPMLVDGRSYFEFAHEMYEFNPENLESITAR